MGNVTKSRTPLCGMGIDYDIVKFYYPSEFDDIIAMRTFKSMQTDVVITPIRLIGSGEWERYLNTMIKKVIIMPSSFFRASPSQMHSFNVI